MTPLANPVTRGEQLYNKALIHTKNSIERVFGIWKRRFPVVAYGIRLKIETVLVIIVATTVLHNMARDMHEPNPPVPDDLNEEELNYLIDTQQIEIEAQEGGPKKLKEGHIQEYGAKDPGSCCGGCCIDRQVSYAERRSRPGKKEDHNEDR
nr:unnamed protein product [Callosobruchus analis]